jgi:hypothetical protein
MQIELFLDQELGMKPIDVEVRIIQNDPSFSSPMQQFGRKPPEMPTEEDQPVDRTSPPQTP